MPKRNEITALPMAVSHTKEELMVMFKDLMAVVEEQIAQDSTTSDAQFESTMLGVGTALDIGNRSEEALQKRESFKQLIEDHEFEEKRIRKAVQRAEDAARRTVARSRLMKTILQTYMEQRGIVEIPTLMGYFKLGNLADKMVVDDEKLIPAEYFDQEALIVTTLNKDRLLAALDSGKEVPGAHLEKNRKNLLIR